MMHSLIAQSPVPVNPSLTDPTSWNELFKTLGFPGGLAVLLIVLGVTVILFVCVIAFKVSRWMFGNDGWLKDAANRWVDRFVDFLDTMEHCQQGIADKATEQKTYLELVHGPGGPGNVNDLRAAGHAAANALLEIGKATHAEVETHIQHIHNALDAGKLGRCDET